MNRQPAKWNQHLVNLDTDKIWKELNRIVGQHKLSRYSTKFDQLIDEGKFTRYTDLTQDLFLILLEKDRFKHYLDTEMSDAEIEMEISQIELTNLLTLELRKRYPEAYRISRRVLQLLQHSKKFKQIDAVKHRRVANQSYGLRHWSISKLTWPIDPDDKLEKVPHYSRDIRHAGCAGDSQIIISNDDLEKLIVLILKAVDAPLTVKQIRKYTMSKLTLMDINLTPIEHYTDDEDKQIFEIPDTKQTPDQKYFETAAEDHAETKVDEFLSKVWLASKEKQKQYKLMINILDLYYLTPNLNQWEVSKKLGVSDSLISGYRKMIDQLLQDLGFLTIEEAKRFQVALKNKLEDSQ